MPAVAAHDVVVVGGGAIGLAVARALDQAGARVAIVEQGGPGSGATWAAAGILSPTESAEWEGPLGKFNAEAIAYWDGWAAELEAEVGRSSGFERMGELRLADSFDSPFLVATEAGAPRFGWDAQRLAGDDVADFARDARGLEGKAVLHLASMGVVNTDDLVEALTLSCARRGVELVADAAVAVSGGPASADVELASGERRSAGRVVVAAGAWSGRLLETAGLNIQVVPLAGDSVVVRPGTAVRRDTLLRTESGSIVPRADGSWWLGTSVRDAGFDTAPELGAVARITATATDLVPQLAEARIESVRSGLRPRSVDGLPIVGKLTDSIALATGHGREGIIHAPLCAAGVALGLLDDDWSRVPRAFAAR